MIAITIAFGTLLSSTAFDNCGGAAPHQITPDMISPTKTITASDLPPGCVIPPNYVYHTGVALPAGCTLPAGVTLPDGYVFPADTTGVTGGGGTIVVPVVAVPLPPVVAPGMSKIYGIDSYAAYIVDYFGYFSNGFTVDVRNARIAQVKANYANTNSYVGSCHYMPYTAWQNSNLRAQAYNDTSTTAGKKWVGVIYKILLQRDVTQAEANYWQQVGQNCANDQGGLFDDDVTLLGYAMNCIEGGILNLAEYHAMCTKTGLNY